MTKSMILAIFLIATLKNISFSQVDVLIIGGGTGGTAAGIAVARMGVKVQILESTSWLGGMLTSAGVSATDGNHELPSGIWGEFRQALYDHYGGAQAVATGWVSHTLFEPSVGNEIFLKMANLPNLRVSFNAIPVKVIRNGDAWEVWYQYDGQSLKVQTKILIDATETGDILPMVGADFRLGMDSGDDTGEAEAPEQANNIVQDITYAVILEDVGDLKSRQGLVKKPKNYTKSHYACACSRKGDNMFGAVLDCQQMLSYARLPNNKYLINWPHCGNDFYLNWPALSLEERPGKIQEAKLFTMGFVYYLQNELGFKNLRIANEFPSDDHFPLIPYHREARRVKGKVFLTVNHLEKPYNYNFYKTGIAVGDYPIDHHHDKNANAPEIDFINIRIPSYNIPLGSIIPERIENFLVAEKNISVSNIVNGTTRLQPVVLGIGQAAGMLAAVAVLENKRPSEISVRQVQSELLKHNAYIMPYIDTKISDPGFISMQKIGATGILKGYGVPYKWANQTWFYPERIVSEFEWKEGLLPYYPQLKEMDASGDGVTVSFVLEVIKRVIDDYSEEKLQEDWKKSGIEQDFSSDTQLNRRSVSMLTDMILNPFEIPIDLYGEIIE